jgi:hypothetical protein
MQQITSFTKTFIAINLSLASSLYNLPSQQNKYLV